MSDDEADPELLALLRQSLGLGPGSKSGPPDTKVVSSAQYIYDNSIDVALDPRSTKRAADLIYQQMLAKGYSTKTWSENELHPRLGEGDLPLMSSVDLVNFVFTLDVLNFSFWSERSNEERFGIEYAGKKWTGYMSLVAALRRALDGGIPITSPEYWVDDEKFTLEELRNVFRSTTDEEIPLLEERFDCLKEAGAVLTDVSSLSLLLVEVVLTVQHFDGQVTELILQANHSAAGLVNLLSDHFPCFRDEHKFNKKTVRILKRAQILVADLWAAFEGEDYGEFDDIDKITIFAGELDLSFQASI